MQYQGLKPEEPKVRGTNYIGLFLMAVCPKPVVGCCRGRKKQFSKKGLEGYIPRSPIGYWERILESYWHS